MANEVVGTHIMIESMVYHKIMHWVNKSSYEVSGLGKITYKDGRITVIDAILLPQKNGSAHTDIEGADVGKAMFLLKDTPGDLRWWWHSHVNMDVFWSGTDRDTIDKITQGGWFVSTVFNKRHEMRSALSMVSPLPLGFIDNIPTQQIQYLDPEEDLHLGKVGKSLSKRERKKLKRLQKWGRWAASSPSAPPKPHR